MEIRAAKEAELAELIDLQCLVFRPTEAEASTRFWSYIRDEPTYQLEQSRILLYEGRIVAHLRVWDRLIRVRGAQLRVGGIGSVLTHPDFRGRGYAQALMRDAEKYMRQAGYDLGMLFTIIGTPFYAKLGWISIPLPTFSLPLDDQKITTSDTGRTLHTQDLSAVMALYDIASADLTGTEVRNPGYWQSGPSGYRGLFPQIGVEHNGQLTGYLNCTNEGTDLEIHEICFAPGDEATCDELAQTLLTTAQSQHLKAIKGSLPVEHPLLNRLSELSNKQPQMGQHEKTMVKLLDSTTLVAKLTDAGPAIANEVEFWQALFGTASAPAWMKNLPAAQGFFYWSPDIF